MYNVYRKSEYLWKSNSILAYDPHTQTLNNFQPVPTTLYCITNGNCW